MTRRTVAVLAVVACSATAHATVPSTTNRIDYTANGTGKAFTFPFVAHQTSHVEVLVAGVRQGSGYSVTLNADQASSSGGTVTFTKAPNAGATVRIQRTVSLTQETVYAPYGAFTAKTIEKAFDAGVFRDQQLERRIDDLTVGAITGGDASALTVAATGSTTDRPLRDWHADVVNVRAFGARGDGSTDDTAAIQAAIDACPMNGVVEFPVPSVAYVVGPLNGKSKCTLRGQQGREWNDTGATIRFRDTAGSVLTLGSGAATVPGMTFRDLVIDCNGTTGKCFEMRTSRTVWDNVVVKNGGAGSYGIWLAHGGSDTAVENAIRNAVVQGFAVNVHVEGNATDGFITDSLLYGSKGKDIELVQAAGWLVRGNHAYGTDPGRTVSIDVQTSNVRVLDNYIEGGSAVGFIAIKQVATAAVSKGTITANQVQLTSNDSIGIDVSATTPSRVSVIGNTVWEARALRGTVCFNVSGANTVYGHFFANQPENCDTGFASAFGGDTMFATLVGERLELSGSEIYLRALGTSVKWLAGSGSPDGVVTANPGGIYARHNATGQGVGAYVKVGGTSNTGWRGITTQMTHRSLTPPRLMADENNYNPTSSDTFAVGTAQVPVETLWRISSNAAPRLINGIQAGEDGMPRVLVNVGTFDITLSHDHASALAGNKIISSSAASVRLKADGGIVELLYDGTNAVWRVKSVSP